MGMSGSASFQYAKKSWYSCASFGRITLQRIGTGQLQLRRGIHFADGDGTPMRRRYRI
jgi:hypothetical protein